MQTFSTGGISTRKVVPIFKNLGLAFKFSCPGSIVKIQESCPPDGDSSVRS